MDHYSVLGVERHATETEIRTAYRRMAMKWHPDRHTTCSEKANAEEQFKRIQQAYTTLSDPQKRSIYDVEINHHYGSMFRQGNPQKNDPYDNWARQWAEKADLYRESLPRGVDVRWVAKISILEAIQGCEVLYTRKQNASCSQCEGYGWHEGMCNSCNGRGDVGTGIRRRLCMHCGGRGVVEWDCGACDGRGKVSVSVSSRIRIPKGVVDGSEMIAEELGKPSRYGGLPGDLHITIRLKPSKGFTFSGHTINGILKVPFSVAMLGGHAAVDLPTGKSFSVEIPARTNSGKKIRLKGAGLSGRDQTVGDALLTVSIVLPRTKRKLTLDEEHVLRMLGD